MGGGGLLGACCDESQGEGEKREKEGGGWRSGSQVLFLKKQK